MDSAQRAGSEARDGGGARGDARGVEPRTPLERARANVEALRALASIESEGRAPTAAERDALRAYSGWGGSPDAFREDLPGGSAWAEVRSELLGLLTDDEYADARASTLTAFYTPAGVAGAMADALAALGVGAHGTASVLEPGCGTGSLVSALEDAGLDVSVTGVEVDPVSARIARALHPSATIVNAPLERCVVSEGGFDAVIANVPYSDDIVLERPDGRRLPIHDYFCLAAVEAVRPGGVVALLTSRFTLDRRSEATRSEIAASAELLAALRLPSETFAQAGTSVVSDLLVLRRRPARLESVDEEWVHTDPLGETRVNALFATRPELVVGAMSVQVGRFGPEPRVSSGLSPDELASELRSRVGALLAPFGDALAAAPERHAEPLCAPRPVDRLPFEYVLDEAGNVWYGDAESVEPVVAPTPDAQARLRDLVSLRGSVRSTLALEASTTDDEAVSAAIAALDRAYEGFVAAHGRVCEARNLKAWATRQDFAISTVRALEVVDSRNRFVSKGDLLTRRVQSPAPPVPDHLEDARDALSVSLDRTGGVDLDLISGLLSCDRDEALARLGDAVVLDPDDAHPVLAEEYLSGDVAGKLGHVRELLAEARDAGRAEAVASWARRLGIPQATELNDVALRVRDALVEAGAWAALCDRDAADTAVIPEAHVDAVDDWRYARHFPLLAAEIVRTGRRPLGMDGQAPYGSILGGMWREVTAFGLWDSRGQNLERDLALLWTFVTAPPERVGERALALAVSGLVSSRRRGMGNGVSAETLTALLPGCDIEAARAAAESPDYPRRPSDTVSGPALEPLVDLARALRESPEVVEYLFTLVRNRTGASAATREGLEQFRREREAFLAQQPSRSPAPVGEAALAALESRLVAAMPPRLGPAEIAPSLGARWIPAWVFLDFCREVLQCPTRWASQSQARHLSISFSSETGRWQVLTSGVGGASDDAQLRFGTPEMSCLKVLEAALNSSQIRVTMPSPDDPERRVTDPRATAAAMRCRQALCDEFKRWALADAGRARALCDLYNERMNRLAPRSFDGSYLTLPGHNPAISLREHQLAAVARVLQSQEGTLIAHVVGAGKTYEGVACAMEARRLGRASKPMFVVPNHLTEQWASDFLALYPSARVLYMSASDTRSADAVRRFWARAATGDWDAVIVGHSRFSQLHVSPERRAAYLDRRVRELEGSIRDARDELGKRDFSVKQLEGLRKRLTSQAERLRSSAPALEGASFEGLGVDFLFVDEAHAFKNLAVETALNVAGVTNAASSKCEDLLDKCAYLRERGLGSNIVFATGTPVSNTMSELYNLMRYLAPGLLRAQGCESFSSWASVFGEVVDSVEVRPEGTGFQLKQRFAKFHNLPELMGAFHLFADVMTAEDLDLDVPECERVNVAVEPTPEQRELVASLGDRADRVRSGQVSPEVDNLLKITSEGRKIALDPKLLAPDDPSVRPLEGGKVEACARNVAAIWRQTADARATQLVFCDTSTPAAGTWNVYEDLKRRLVELGVPEGEVAFVSDAGDNPRRREELFERVNEGAVRVLVGSTQKLGTGTNVQRLLVATHDLDCPWRPSDLEQRLGRIVRQGNTHDHVRAFRYVTSGTFDSYLYQTVERKQRFVSQVFTNRSPVREAADLDEAVLDYGTIKALATGDPTVRRRMELENRAAQLELLRQAYASGQERTRADIELTLGPCVRAAKATLAQYETDLAQISAVRAEIASWEPGACRITVMGRAFASAKEAGEALAEAARLTVPPEGGHATVGTVASMEIAVTETRRELDGAPVFVRHLALVGSAPWPSRQALPAPGSGASAIRQLSRIADGFAAAREEAVRGLERAQERLAQAREALGRPWDGEEEWRRVREELAATDPSVAAPAQEQEAAERTVRCVLLGQDGEVTPVDVPPTLGDIKEALGGAFSLGPSFPSRTGAPVDVTVVLRDEPAAGPEWELAAPDGTESIELSAPALVMAFTTRTGAPTDLPEADAHEVARRARPVERAPRRSL